jgi:hydrogenase maturation factor HypF (carbamoyltransferase family)
VTCEICKHGGTIIEIKEDLEDKNHMYKFISCSSCGRLLERQKWTMEGY